MDRRTYGWTERHYNVFLSVKFFPAPKTFQIGLKPSHVYAE